MNTFIWNSQLETGNASLDSEHKQAFKLIDECIEFARSGTKKEELVVRLNVMHERLAGHFKEEEAIMLCIGKPLPDTHKKQHRYMLDFMKSKISDLADGKDKAMTVQGILIYLYDWRVNHIEDVDKKLANQY